MTHHKNPLRLIGFCDEGPHKLLLYELMCNGTLGSFLFGSLVPDWKIRTQLEFEIARGLMYLHNGCSTTSSTVISSPKMYSWMIHSE
ncbi:hypothetical protein VitviT2T_020665 [Vitis vinifera]|uniref:Protein kinase domain-containing protein n=1 Tax=Vitis vinifera TaxID=29760 RepID=A0ABY9D4P8_VITVI|nr:hypothetical protein VitviT2T_020665 [Vitis vinifera]